MTTIKTNLSVINLDKISEVLKKAKSNKGAERWITVRGRHILIGSSGEVKQGGKGMSDGKDIKKINSSKKSETSKSSSNSNPFTNTNSNNSKDSENKTKNFSTFKKLASKTTRIL